MSQLVGFTPVPIGAVKPNEVGGGVNAYDEMTKVDSFANAKINPTYGFKIYESNPEALKERSGHYSVVVQQPDNKRLAQPNLDNVFTPSRPEEVELTKYFTRVLPQQTKNVKSAMALNKMSLDDLLERYIRGKLQEDAEEVMARYAGATEVERQLAEARLQNRYSDMIRQYGSESRLRDALMREMAGDQIDPALRGAITKQLRSEQAGMGAGSFPVVPGAAPESQPADAPMAMADIREGEIVGEEEAKETELDIAEEDSAAFEGTQKELFEARTRLERLKAMYEEAEAEEKRLMKLYNLGAEITEEEMLIAQERTDEIHAEVMKAEDVLADLGQYMEDGGLPPLSAVDTAGDKAPPIPAVGAGSSYAASGTDSTLDTQLRRRVGTGFITPAEHEMPTRFGGSGRPIAQASDAIEAPAVPPTGRASLDPGASQAYRIAPFPGTELGFDDQADKTLGELFGRRTRAAIRPDPMSESTPSRPPSSGISPFAAAAEDEEIMPRPRMMAEAFPESEPEDRVGEPIEADVSQTGRRSGVRAVATFFIPKGGRKPRRTPGLGLRKKKRKSRKSKSSKSEDSLDLP